ncbi:MAG: hypothetical protein P9L99_02855 [Candidatus Lernaella stagnicola]|nr:hypothetical protein [Candidatus Lernaella stagnicola]
MSNSLPVMIGVVHRDPVGEERLLTVLRRYRPAIVTLEVSPYAMAFREENGPRLVAQLESFVPAERRDHGEIAAIRETLRQPFELRAAQQYAAENGCRVELVDDSEISRLLLQDVEDELLTEANIARLLKRPDYSLSRTVASFYRRARRLLADEPVPPTQLGFSVERLALMQVRDERMAARLHEIVDDALHDRWVHVGGVFHLLRVKGLRLLWEHLAARGVDRALLEDLVGSAE